jgi:hypothetical protein
MQDQGSCGVQIVTGGLPACQLIAWNALPQIAPPDRPRSPTIIRAPCDGFTLVV